MNISWDPCTTACPYRHRPPPLPGLPLVRQTKPRPTLPVCACSHEQGYREDDGLYLESDTDEQLL